MKRAPSGASASAPPDLAQTFAAAGRGLTPRDAAEARALLVDIRPQEERRSALGFVPASVSHPMSDVSRDSVVRLEALREAGETLVLVCTSGRRSATLLGPLAERLEGPVTHMDGGLLRWRADGLPTCGVTRVDADPVLAGIAGPSQLVKALRACFVAEMVERMVGLDEHTALDPMALLKSCFESEHVPWDEPEPEELYVVIDRMALISRRTGGALETIVSNTDRMVDALRRVERTVADS